MLVNLLLVAAGSALGGMLRYLTAIALGARSGAFPIWTLVVNLIGGFAIGALAGAAPLSARMRLLAMTGVCGGFTTFSAFSLETIELWRISPSQAIANVGLSVSLSIVACWLGWRAAAGT